MQNNIQCSFCNSTTMRMIMDFGSMALAGGFLEEKSFATEPSYKMRLYFCESCFAVQIIDKINEEELFQDYFYFSSSIKTLSSHFKSHAEQIVKQFFPSPKEAKVMEFGCNDGILLRPLSNLGIGTLIGVDPASNVVNQIDIPNVSIVNDFFNEETAKTIIKNYGYLDMVLANNVYAHISDIQGITKAIESVLKEDGIFIFEVHYLDKIINEMQYDMIYHEHIYYHSLLSLENHFNIYNMKVFNVEPIPIHAGSMRYYVCKKGSTYEKEVSDSVRALKEEELTKGFNSFATFSDFADKVKDQKYQLMSCLDEIKSQGKTIAGYGASGRANTIIQYCGINHTHLEYLIDDSPAKQGYYTPGSHFSIKSSEILRTNPPDYILVFAWSFLEEITNKNKDYFDLGGKMIVPLPDVKIIGNK